MFKKKTPARKKHGETDTFISSAVHLFSANVAFLVTTTVVDPHFLACMAACMSFIMFYLILCFISATLCPVTPTC